MTLIMSSQMIQADIGMTDCLTLFLFCLQTKTRGHHFLKFITKTVSGAYKGALSSLRAHEIGSIVIKEALIRAKVQPEEVSEVIMGQVQLISTLLLFPHMR